MPPKKSTKATQVSKETKPVPPQRKYKGHQEWDHDLFKLKLEKLKMNKSWIFRAPRLVDVEHCHFFHSVNPRTGAKNSRCTHIGGHFHEVEFEWVNGKPVTKCGPAMKEVKVKLPGRKNYVTQVRPLSWPAVNQKTGEELTLVDKHTHEIDYLWSETLSPKRLADAREDQRATIEGMVSKQSLQELATSARQTQELRTKAGEMGIKVEGG